jgi:hypothetical protein
MRDMKMTNPRIEDVMLFVSPGFSGDVSVLQHGKKMTLVWDKKGGNWSFVSSEQYKYFVSK